ISETFARRGSQADYCRIDTGESLPEGHEGWDGLVMMGGAQYAEDDAQHPYLGPSADLARAFHDAGKPVLGVCLGSQVLARGLGARVRKQGWTELGFTELTPTAAAKDDPLLAGVGPTRLMQYHEDTFDLPEGAVPLMTGTRCPNQAYRSGASYGFQCHFEVSTRLWQEWMSNMSETLKALDPVYHESWQQDFARHESESVAFCERISDRWLDLVEQRVAKAA
ncbi:MAG: type 1 glutamine amidotransferase, partial [Proteobacteria bacterium]|nr:type 1 glutamine amidotransferase [Pseudomonadota bacterium]